MTTLATTRSMRICVVTYYSLEALSSAPGNLCDPLIWFSERRAMHHEVGSVVRSLVEIGHDVNYFGIRIHAKNADPLTRHLNDSPVDVCLWVDHSYLAVEDIAEVKRRTCCKHAVFYYDPTRNEFPIRTGLASLFDIAFVTDNDTPVFNGPPTGYTPVPVSPYNFRPFQRKNKYDIMFATTNLYSGHSHTAVDRATVIGELSAAFQKRFAFACPNKAIVDSIAGADASWIGSIGIADLPALINESSVCLCLHADCTVNRYTNQRICELLMAGAHVLVDDVKGYREWIGDAVVYIDPLRPIVEQVKEMLDTDPDLVRERRKRARKFAIEHMSERAFAVHVDKHIVKLME